VLWQTNEPGVDYAEGRPPESRLTSGIIPPGGIIVFKEWLTCKADENTVSWYSRPPDKHSLPDAAKVAEELRRGGELWEFCSPPETWAQLMGWGGYVVVRDGEIVACFVNRQS
jgi:hypothetical protein